MNEKNEAVMGEVIRIDEGRTRDRPGEAARGTIAASLGLTRSASRGPLRGPRGRYA